ncbi:MAG: SDR family oxidoreductase [Proteobacteria bacterium]|nr:SDR family oxidoreductase [Pseudomonadota bacterium]
MKTALITGANRGIGLELAKQLQAKDYKVIATCRQSSPELEQLNCQIESQVDVTDSKSIQLLADKLTDTKIDLLINNAGFMHSMSLDKLDFDAMRMQYEINTLGPLRVTASLLPNMHKGSKIAIITSRMGSIADGTGSQYGYRMSKAAVNMVGNSLAKDLKAQKIAVALLHPGYVRTDMTGNQGFIDTDESARGLIQRIAELNMENTGSFWHANGSLLPW